MNGRYWIVALLLTSFAFRLHALLQLPGFVDEGNHLLWAVEVWQGRLVFPFSTAKPLEIFYLAVLMPFRSPLWVGRLGSVFMGGLTLSGLWGLGHRWKKDRVGLWAAVFYAFMPWTFFHERTAVADPMVAALAVLVAWAAAAWARRPRLRRTLGLALGLFALPMAKLSAAPLMLMPVVVVGLQNRSAARSLSLAYGLAIAGLAVVLGAASLRYNVLGEVALRAEGSAQAGWLAGAAGNMVDLLEWSGLYAGTTGLLMVAGSAVAIGLRPPAGVIGLAGCALGLTALLTPATSYPRYVLPTLAFGSLLSAEAVDFALTALRPNGMRLAAAAILIAGLSVSFLNFAFTAYRDPAQLPLAESDRNQHVTGWASGYGIREAAEFTAGAIAGEYQPAVYAANLATRVTGWLYWPPGAKSKLYTLWDAAAPDVVSSVASGQPVYLIVDSGRDSANFQGLTINPHEAARFERPLNGAPVIVYRLMPEPFEP